VFDIYNVFGRTIRSLEIGFLYAITFALLLATIGCQRPESGSLSVPANADPEKFRVATSGDYPPFSDWPHDQAEPAGFSISVARAYARERGATIEWVRFRWPELATKLERGSFDFALSGITIRPDRSVQGRFSLPLTTSGAVVLVPSESSLHSPADLNQTSIRIAVNAGGHLERVARRLFSAAHIDAIPDNASVPRALVPESANASAADAVVTDSIEAPRWQQSSAIALRAIGPLTRDLKAAWFPPENEREVHRFDRWLLEAEANGQLERLRARHGLALTKTARTGPALLASLDERLSLMPAVADAKSILDAPIENLAREEIVLDSASRSIRQAALAAEVPAPDEAAVRRFFRAQIEAAKWIQMRRQEETSERSQARTALAQDEARTTLDQRIRPALIFLGDRISNLLVIYVAEKPRALDYDAVRIALARYALPEAHLRELHEALYGIVRP
jgi:cyclohexadienyl dehydratase